MSIKVIPTHNYSGLMEMYLNQDTILNNIDDTKEDGDGGAFDRTCKRFTKQIETMNTIVKTLDRKCLKSKDKAQIDEIVKNANVGCEKYVPLFTFVNKKDRKGLNAKLHKLRNVESFGYIFPVLSEYNNQLIIEDFKCYQLYDSQAFWKIKEIKSNELI